MSLTKTQVRSAHSVTGNSRRNVYDLTFDDAYPVGGEPLSPRALGLDTVIEFRAESQQGYSFQYDKTNQKLKVYRQGPYLRIEATGTFTAGAAYTLAQRPAYIIAIRGTAGSTGAKRLIPTGETLSAGQCSINFTTGVITWGDATITAATIVYVPLGVPGFTEDLLVVDELVSLADATGGQGRGTLANRAACINYIWNDEDNEVLTYVPVTEVPGANECDIDILNTADTTIDVLTSDIGNGAAKLKACYIKYNEAAHARLLQWIDQADIALDTNVVDAHSGASAAKTTLHRPGLILPGFGQCVVGEATATNKFALFVDPAASAAAGVVVFNPYGPVWTGHSNEGFTTIEIPLLYIPSELAGGVLQELPGGTNLSWLSGIRVVVEGW